MLYTAGWNNGWYKSWVTGGFQNPSITVGAKFHFQPGRRDMRERRNFQVGSFATLTRHDSGTLAQDQTALHIGESRHGAKLPVPVSGKRRTLTITVAGVRLWNEGMPPAPLFLHSQPRLDPAPGQRKSEHIAGMWRVEERVVSRDHWSV